VDRLRKTTVDLLSNMNHLFLLLQTPEAAARIVEKTEPLNFTDLYNIVSNWLLLHGPRIVIALVVFAIGQWLIRLLRTWLQKKLARRKVNTSVRPFLSSMLDVIVQVLLFVIVMQILGLRLTLFAAVVASFGVALGLALSGTLQNFTCGLLILFLKPFKVADCIIAQGQEGVVESIQIFYTVVRSKDNRTVIIPNSKLSNEVIIKIPDVGNPPIDTPPH
jgi:small conductance mechanosensitive channel